jgi:serine O-acetyltransferase
MSGRRPESRIVADKSWDIDGIVAELADLRAIPQKRHYQGRPLPELPSRKVIVAVVDGLVAALYPHHFGPARLSADGVDLFVADTLGQTLNRYSPDERRTGGNFCAFPHSGKIGWWHG